MRKITDSYKGKLAAYFKGRLGMFDYKNGWMKGDCPNCGAVKKFGVNISQDRTNCFVCTYNDRPTDLVMQTEGLRDLNETRRFLGTFESATFLEPPVVELKPKDVILPESFKLLNMGDSLVGRIVRNYMRGRGFSIKRLSLLGVGYCSRGKYKFRVIIPFYQQGRLIYFNARQFLEIGPKFKNPPVEDFGIGKNMLIFNIDALAIYKTIYLNESATNALTIGDQGIAIGGKVISDYQLSTILRSPAENIIILLDPDAFLFSIKMALTLCMHKRVKAVRFPDDTDVNSLGKKKAMEFIKNTPYGNYSYFIKLKNDYEKTLDSHF